ncbi:MAG: MerC domain-containing protein [Leptolyngbya sp.]|nr:MerC domain-containing protein [Candidatus Melainabacteria bacterium]
MEFISTLVGDRTITSQGHSDKRSKHAQDAAADKHVAGKHSGGDCCGGNASVPAVVKLVPGTIQKVVKDAEQSLKGGSCCGGDDGHSHGHSKDVPERKRVAGETAAFSKVVGDEVVVSPEEVHAHIEKHDKIKRIMSLDSLGIFASTLCLIHCMAMPFIIAFLPFLGLQFLEGEFAHRVIASFVFLFAIFAIGPGYRQHRRKDVLVFTILGLSMVAGALLIAGPYFGEQYELPFITLGNLTLVIVHLRNRKLCACAH